MHEKLERKSMSKKMSEKDTYQEDTNNMIMPSQSVNNVINELANAELATFEKDI